MSALLQAWPEVLLILLMPLVGLVPFAIVYLLLRTDDGVIFISN